MELKKKKETLWTIDKKDQEGCFKLRSTEIGGKIDLIGVGLSKSNIEVFFDMTPEEFKSFFTILKAFKDLVNSEGIEFVSEEMDELQDSQISINGDSIERGLDKKIVKSITSLASKTDENEINENGNIKSSSNMENDEVVIDRNNNDIYTEKNQEIDENTHPENEQNSNLNSNPQDQEFNEDSINIDEIFKDIDSVTPQDIKEKGLEFGNEDSLKGNSSEESEIEEKENHKKSENEKKEGKGEDEEDLNPLDWDPW